ncbi:MAG: asparagine synthase (glutamine-hydrolyzing) [SAR324 cluster bacterium]|nr:asparagine synthase (glutamine-hydrolyzing) [SAR324 cluster bacterium]
MCGIYGYIGTESFDSDRVLKALNHRGPDSQGQWDAELANQKIQLLHTRLAILDLKPTGQQPMIDPINGNVIVFNGEIYNFRELRQQMEARGLVFHSESDTEVLLLAYRVWGKQFLERLDGMFAFLLFDKAEQSLLLARDHVGIKPLYYAQTKGGGWVFSSEVRALMESKLVSEEWDADSIHQYLVYGSIQEPGTIRKAIHAFPPAHYACFDLRQIQKTIPDFSQYWNLHDFSVPNHGGAIEMVHHAEVLSRTLEQQRIADVPVGLFLSAGIDSTVLAGTLAELDGSSRAEKGAMTAFTFGLQDSSQDESQLAAMSARQLGLKHETSLLPEKAIFSWLSDGFAAMDQPSSDGMNTYLISRAASKHDIKVVLSGCGADELHGGYPHFRSLNRLWEWRQRLGKWENAILPLLASAFRFCGNPILQERLLLLLKQRSPAGMVQEKRRFFVPTQIKSIWPEYPFSSEGPIEEIRYTKEEVSAQISMAEIQGYLKNTLLRDSDWATMANHQELRVPYLGKRYLETVMGISWKLKQATRKRNKPLLSHLLPRESQWVQKRNKTGFELDYARYLKGPLRDQMHTAFVYLKQKHGFQINPDQIETSLQTADNKQVRRYWSLLSLGLYLKRHS